MTEDVPPALHPPVSLALAKAVDSVPAEAAGNAFRHSIRYVRPRPELDPAGERAVAGLVARQLHCSQITYDGSSNGPKGWTIAK
ncbi:hypothetical protein DFO47_11296 [Arthrobacter sp. AG258]|nr:hypothetical protein DFO47_11296 [Arthrobacter sp. AG258]